MSEEDNIYIKLEIEKDLTTGELIIVTRFDLKAPNFSQDKNGINWIPTSAERNFLNDVFGTIRGKK